MKYIKRFFVFFLLLALVIVGVVYFSAPDDRANAEQTGAQPQQPAVPVSIETVQSEQVQIWKQFSARLEAVEFAEIRPQVSGRITDIRFDDGQLIEKGEVIYVIDPRPFEAALNQAKAELRAAQNEWELARKELKRAQGLIETNAISQRIFDERQSRAETAEAQVQRAKSLVEQAEINLDYAFIEAPISGQLSRAEIKVGNLVEAANAPVLTSIVSTDGIYADFEIDEQTYLDFIKGLKTSAEKPQIPVRLILDQNSGDGPLTYNGFIDSFDNRIDISSGTIRARAYFKNEDRLLVPGMFAQVEVGTPEKREVIMISERVVGTDQDRKYVYVVDGKNIAQYREIKIGQSIDGRRIVTSGLEQGDRVITDGIIRMRPGTPVQSKENMDSSGSQEQAAQEMDQ